MDDIPWFAAAAAATTYQSLDLLMNDLNDRTRPHRPLEVRIVEDPKPEPTFVNALDYATEPSPSWDEYVGQPALKARLRRSIASAKIRGTRLDHVLLASGMPGVGKTKAARCIAHEMGCQIVELVPKFSIDTLIAACMSLNDGDILFIDEIHKMAETGKRGAEALLKLLEEHVIYLDGEAVRIPNITVIGATTDVDMLPEPVVDRFKIKPYFERYSVDDLAVITMRFMEAHEYDWDPDKDSDLIWGIAQACRSTPRVCEEFVLAARDLAVTDGRKPSAKEVLRFQQVEADGMTRQHIAYLTNMFRYNKRTVKNKVEWVAGEAVMMSMLRETKQGIQRIERFLMEQGYIDRTPSGRRLTPAGIKKAQAYIKRGL